MIKTNKNSQQITSSTKKFLEDQKVISAYLRGEIALETLHEKGIKLSMPL